MKALYPVPSPTLPIEPGDPEDRKMLARLLMERMNVVLVEVLPGGLRSLLGKNKPIEDALVHELGLWLGDLRERSRRDALDKATDLLRRAARTAEAEAMRAPQSQREETR